MGSTPHQWSAQLWWTSYQRAAAIGRFSVVHFITVFIIFILWNQLLWNECVREANGTTQALSAGPQSTSCGDTPRAFPAPCFGSATQEGIMSEISAGQNLARYGFFCLLRYFKAVSHGWSTPKGIRADRLMGVNQLEQLGRDSSSPAGKPSFVKCLHEKGKPNTWNVTQRGFSANSAQALALLWAVSCLCCRDWCWWHQWQLLCGSWFILSSNHLDAKPCASLSHQEYTGRKAALLFSQQILQCTWVGLDLMVPYRSLPTQDILSVVSRIQPLQHQCMEKLQTRESIYKNGVWRDSTLQQGWWGPYVLIARYALLSGSTGVISVLVPALCH